MVDRACKVQPEGTQLGNITSHEKITIEEPMVKVDSHADLVKMTPAGFETSFPRKDNYFMTKQSLNFQDAHNRVWQIREKGKLEGFQQVFLHVLLGLTVGFIGFLMDLVEMMLVWVKDKNTQTLISQDNAIVGWLWYTFFSVFLVLIATTMATWWGTGSAGSGVAEVIGYVNGVNYPLTIDFKTFLTKIVGVVLSVAGGLAVGKEGPLAHIGANVGAAIVNLPSYEFCQNDYKKRQLIVAGASAGVSVAFGAPVGGALFMYELSRLNPMWKFDVLWKTFLTCGTAVFTAAVCDNILHGIPVSFSESALKFAKARPEMQVPISLLPGAFIIGTISGLLGAFFLGVNFRLAKIRGAIWTQKWHKLIDAFVFAFLTATTFYWLPRLFQTCEPIFNDKAQLLKDKTESVFDRAENIDVSIGWCNDQKDHYNPIATILWKTEGGFIRHFIDSDPVLNKTQLFVIGALWYFWTITTYGVNVPSGLFLPGMIVGCALGDLYNSIIIDNGIVDPATDGNHRVTYVILGMGAMLAGYTRMTYSLVVIVMETSQNVNIFIPVVIAVGMSNFMGNLCNRSLYEKAVRAKQMPILISQVPHCNRLIRAEQFMSKEVVSLKTVDTLENIYKACQTNHSAFPLITRTGRVVGLISKNYLITLISEKAFYHNKKGIASYNERAYSSKEGAEAAAVNSSIADDNEGRKMLSEGNKCEFEDSTETLELDSMPLDDTKVILSWSHFRVEYTSLDKVLDEQTIEICQKNSDELVDMRSYMIEHPETCTQLDFLPKVLARFRALHLRHMIVTNPYSGHAHGIITRGDIFKFMPL